MRHKKAERRKMAPDKLYKNILVGRFINRIMKDGKKSVAQKLIYSAFDALKEKGQDPVQTLEKAVQNVGPRQEIKARRVGGANYQVPIEVRGDRKTSLAIRWIVQAAKSRSNKEYHSFDQKLVAELLDAVDNRGEAVKKRDTMHRQAEANKAFAHFRW